MFHDTADYAETCPREISKASDLWRFPVRNALGSVSNNRNFNQLHIEMHQMLPAIASPKFSQAWQFRLFLHCDLRRKKTRNEVIVCVCVCVCLCISISRSFHDECQVTAAISYLPAGCGQSWVRFSGHFHCLNFDNGGHNDWLEPNIIALAAQEKPVDEWAGKK